MDISNPFFSPDFHLSENAQHLETEMGNHLPGKYHTTDCGFGSSGAGFASVSVPATDVGHLRRPCQLNNCVAANRTVPITNATISKSFSIVDGEGVRQDGRMGALNFSYNLREITP
jgi:hypothetical protein